jgi:NAD(P)H-nitrite reductase large subunit
MRCTGSGLRTTVVQRSERLLVGQLDERASDLLERYFLGLGVNVVLGATPVAVTDDDLGLAVSLADRDAVAGDIVVVCVGIRPAVDLAAAAGLEVARGIVVDDHMRTSDPLIYAAGDVAEYRGVTHGLWSVAAAQAEVAAANAVGDDRTFDAHPPVTVLKGVGLAVKSIGDADGTTGDELVAREPAEDEARYWKLVVRDGVAVGAVLLGDWPESAAVLDAVASGWHVSHLLPALRAGDLSAFNEETPAVLASA